jgi:hypothetical protein
MIISKIMGGLGNQMFCYAAGRAAALRNGVELKLNISGYPDADGRSYELWRYGIQAGTASHFEIEGFRKHDAKRPWNRLIRNTCFWRTYGQTRHFRQRGYAFDPEFVKIGNHAKIDGLFQSELFFQSAASEIRRELRLKDEHLDEANHNMAERMRSCESVSLHVRRTDYVQHPQYSRIVEPCSMDYYHKALKLIDHQVVKPSVFVFSDEPEWCRANLPLPNTSTIVDLNGPDKPCLDMHLMSSCKHHIVANSSFSWWGAWLAQSECQIVIAPSPWLRPDSGLDDRDIVPKRWISL